MTKSLFKKLRLARLGALPRARRSRCLHDIDFGPPLLVRARTWGSAVATCGLMTLVALQSAQGQVRPTHLPEIADVDRRTPASLKTEDAAQRQRGMTHFKAMLPAANLDWDQLLDTPKFIRARDGFLTGPKGLGRGVAAQTAQAIAEADPHRPVKAFLNEHSALFGHGAEVLKDAKISRETVAAHNGLRTVVWQQQLDGLPVFESVMIGNITKAGELVSLSSQFLPSPARSPETSNRSNGQRAAMISVTNAILAAAADLGETWTAADIVATAGPVSEGGYLSFRTPREAYARQVWMPLDHSRVRLCWEVMLDLHQRHERFLALVDSQTGGIWVRRNLTRYISTATYNVYTSDSPSPFSPAWPTPSTAQPPLTSRTLVTIDALSTNASPNGWINDGDNSTKGNNAECFLDRNDDGVPDVPEPVGNPTRVFNFPLDLTMDPKTYADASTVQLFYWINWYHDRLYDLGFTEAAGNYQQDNFGRGGLGNDNLIGQVQDGADIGQANNSFFIPAPDGIHGSVHMFIFTGPTPNRDGSLDAEVMLHEITHGTSSRLVGGGVGISALQTAGMGEGWSDFYAESLLSQPGDDLAGTYPEGGYVTYQFVGITTLPNYYFGIRHYPYCTDMTKNPFTFKDIDPTQISPHTGVPFSPLYSPFSASEADEVHHQGEVWCVTLWDARANLVAQYGYLGNQLMLKLATDGMKLGPANPNFLQARDAIILADRVDSGGANLDALWRAFAKRGMGASATSPNSSTTIGVVEAYDLPGLSEDSVVVLGGNGNGMVDPNECDDLQIFLLNNTSSTATGISTRLSSSTPGVVVGQAVSAYPDIPSGGTNANLTLFKISTLPDFVCGAPVAFSLVIQSAQGTRTNNFTVPTGIPGTPVRFDDNVPVAIPDDNPIGASSPVTVAGLSSALSKVTVSLFITHTFDSDLLLQLVAPDGTTCTLSANNGGSGHNYGVSCSDSSRTVFDDAGTSPISSGVPPFIGTFQPDQPLSIFAGKAGASLNGTWILHVIDQAAIDVGTIQCWSLFLSPATCPDGGGVCPGVDLALGIIGRPDPVALGSNLVYTISVTNRGPNAAKGVAVSQVLPDSVVFVSAVASQGSVVVSGNTLSASLGGMPVESVATIIVTVIPTAAGEISSTASVTSLDVDVDPSNNTGTSKVHVNPPSADLAVTLAATPNPALVGGTLTYSLTATNYGPLSATGVIVSNALPPSVGIVSVTSTRGTIAIVGNVVLLSLGSLDFGQGASATIIVVPGAQGAIVATATISGDQLDPFMLNNRASVTTTVGPAADLAVSFLSAPPAVVLGSNITYKILGVNLGPSAATSVTLSEALPAGTRLVSSNTTLGTFSVTNGIILCKVGALDPGATVTNTLVLAATNSGTVVFTATIAGAQADPVPTNNTATATTIVAPPFISIVPAGATLLAESYSPPNGAVDLGETVTMQLRLQNIGNIPAANLKATLLAINGVTSPSPTNAVSYGNLLPGATATSSVPFSFTATGTNGGSVVATLQLQDAATNNRGTASFTFDLPNVATFANSNTITIPDSGPATPYPSTITVSGVTGLVSKVTATLSGFTHTYPHDVNVLLVGPTGASALIMAHAAEFSSADNITLTLDDAAPFPLPSSGQLSSGSWQPAAYGDTPLFTNPAPAGPYTSALAVFANLNANGVWSLYVLDDSPGDQGMIAGGWSLAVTTITPVKPLADLVLTSVAAPNPVMAGANLTYAFTITNAGPNTANNVAFSDVLPPTVGVFSTASSQGSITAIGNSVTANLNAIPARSNATVTIVVTPTLAAAGLLTNTASVTAFETDLNTNNNFATTLTTVSLTADLGLAQSVAPNPVLVGSNVSFTISLTNNGPNTALNVVMTNQLPSVLGSPAASPSVGSASIAGGTVTWYAGDLGAGNSATITISAVALAAGTLTNTATATTTSVDTNAANNSASAVLTIANPAPYIVPAGARVVSPPNGNVAPGATVTVMLTLANTGSADTTNLLATLQPSGGVGQITSGQAAYGHLVRQGPSVSSSNFTFSVSVTNGAALTLTLQLQDGASNLGLVAFTIGTTTFANPAAIIIPDHGPATPYPSTINVLGWPGVVSKATVTLSGVTHSFPDDIGVLIIGPTGQQVVLMNDTGGGHSISNLTLNFDDAATQSLPSSGQIISGTYKPTTYNPANNFPGTPPGQAATALAAFNGTNPNGTWSLYVYDDSPGDSGSIANGWSLKLAPAPALLSGSLSNHLFQISLVGQPGLTYIVQSSPDLVSWTPLATNVSAADGTLQITDTANISNFKARYYRALLAQ